MKQNKQWYFQVNEYCQNLSDYHNVPLIKIAGILSALSPNNTFRSNVLSLERFLRTSGNCKVTCFDGQKRKAQAILDSPNTITESEVKAVLKGAKTMAFFENIYRPSTSESVTVDRHQVTWAKQTGLIPTKGVLTAKRYKLIEDAVREIASDIGLLPHQGQAISWVMIRGAAW